jgi:hypothetical protein
MCNRTSGDETRCTSNVFDTMVIGSRQHTQNDSSRQSLPWNGGMFDTDRLEINTLTGNDTVDSVGLAAGTIQLFVDGVLVP